MDLPGNQLMGFIRLPFSGDAGVMTTGGASILLTVLVDSIAVPIWKFEGGGPE
jgi:hypothetical protein